MIALKSMTSLLGQRPRGVRPYYRSGYTHIPLSQLHLSLVCDVEDFKASKAIVESLLDGKLPSLASCNIRLGRDCNLALYDLACKAAA